MTNPTPQGMLYLSAGVGALILWAKMRREDRKAFALTEIINAFTNPNQKRLRLILELIIFISLGCYVTILLFGPTTEGQAFAAGLGWTAGLTVDAGKGAK